jgi:hypothetical protein
VFFEKIEPKNLEIIISVENYGQSKLVFMPLTLGPGWAFEFFQFFKGISQVKKINQ